MSGLNNLQDQLQKIQLSHPVHDEVPKSPEEGIKRLLEGNKLWSDGDVSKFINILSHEITPEIRNSLQNTQKPYVTIITCSDSRVSPELIFCEGIGFVFIIRVAGNIAGELGLGSIEYGVGHLGTPLLLIMGHQGCGAVQATLDSVHAGSKNKNHRHHDHIASIVKMITPAAEAAHKKYPDLDAHKKEAMEFAVKENVKNSKKNILQA